MITRIKRIGNRQNFDRLARFAAAFAIGSILFQIVSAITEGNGIFRFVETVVGSTMAALFFAGIIVIAWELLIRSGAQYVTRTLAQWRLREVEFSWLEVPLIILAGSLTVGLAYFSKNVSKENCYVVFQYFAPEAEQKSDKQVYKTNADQLALIASRYESRHTPIKERYDKAAEAKRALYDAKVEDAKREVTYWQKREKDHGKNYTYTINLKLRKVKKYEAEKAEEMGVIADQYNNELAVLDQWRSTQEAIIDSTTMFQAGTIYTDNKTKSEIYNTWIEKYSRIWADFAGWAVVIALLLIVFQTLFEVMAQIEREVVVPERFFEVGFLTEIYEAFVSVIIIPTRNFFRKLVNRQKLIPVSLEPTKVPTSTVPTEPEPELIDYRQLETDNRQLSVEIDNLKSTIDNLTKYPGFLSDKGSSPKAKPTKRETVGRSVGKKKSTDKRNLSVELSETKTGKIKVIVGKNIYTDMSTFVDNARKWYERQFTSAEESTRLRNKIKWENAIPVLRELGASVKPNGKKVNINFDNKINLTNTN